MNSGASVEQPKGDVDLNKGMRKRARQLVVQTLAIGAIFFLSAGTFRWPGAWAYLAVYVVGIAINGVILLRVNPEVIAERAEVREETKGWDRVVTSVAMIFILAMFIVAGLDWRFGWSPAVPLWLWLAALVVLILGSAFSSWAMISNAYFATTVSIQEDRGHTVATGGPYQFVRHPAYSGWMLSTLATPLVLGSLWAYIPAGLVIISFVVRTALEDKTLRAELDGYEAYAEQVRYRLAPGLW
jgi:protein-S-isoprenylcysteine O-methyltransferase Ste14